MPPARAQQARRLHLVVERERVSVEAVRSGRDAALDEDAAEISGVPQRPQHRAAFPSHEREIALADRVVGELDSEPEVAEHFNRRSEATSWATIMPGTPCRLAA